MSRIIIKIWIYILPLPLFIIMIYLWQAYLKTPRFTAYVLLLPLLYGYIIPGIGTNIMKKWRFKGKLVIGNYYIHHGFNYSSNMNVLLLISFSSIIPGMSLTLARSLVIIVVAGILHGFVFWIHDILLIKAGMLEILKPVSIKGKSAEEIVFRYAPLSFSLIGVTYAMSSLLAYDQLIIQHKSGLFTFSWVMAVGFILMSTIPSIAYGLTENCIAIDNKNKEIK